MPGTDPETFKHQLGGITSQCNMYLVHWSGFLEQTLYHSQLNDAGHEPRGSVVEPSPTVTQSTGEDGVPHSSRSLHPPQSHARAKDLGESTIRHRISAVVWITPVQEAGIKTQT